MEKNYVKKAGIGIKAGAIKNLTGFIVMNDGEYELLYQHPFAPRRENGSRVCVGILFEKHGDAILLPFEVIYDDKEVFLANFDSKEVINIHAAMCIWEGDH